MRIALIGSGRTMFAMSAMAFGLANDVYAEFGVNSAVMSSNNITEHEQNMLALNVSARDGDDAITLQEPQEETSEGDQEEETSEGEGDNQDEPGEASESGEEGDNAAFEPLGEPDDELIQASAKIDEYADGFAHMRAQAIKLGLSPEVAANIEAEYEEDNQLSEKSLKALEAVGYSRQFVASYLQGQEAIASTYVAQIQAYAGGPEKFSQIMNHLTANSPDAAQALEAAIQRQDLAGIKTIINLGMASRTKKFGKQPERSVSRKAPASPQTPVAKGPQGFESSRDMVSAMSDPRYATDPKYRQEVERKVGASRF